MTTTRRLILYCLPDKDVAVKSSIIEVLAKSGASKKYLTGRLFRYEIMAYELSSENLSLYAVLFKVFEGKKQFYSDSKYFTMKEKERVCKMFSLVIGSFGHHEKNCLSCDSVVSSQKLSKLIKTWKQSLKIN